MIFSLNFQLLVTLQNMRAGHWSLASQISWHSTTPYWADSQLVAKQVQKEYNCNNEIMVRYLAEVRKMEMFFDGFEVWYVPHLDNRDADHLAWIASSRARTPPDVIVEKLSKPSVKPEESISEATGANLMIIDELAQ
jgi:hypothetical protein